MPKPRGNWKVRECSDHIETLLESYASRSGDDPETQLTDLLADAMHYAYRHHINFEARLSSAELHAMVEQEPKFREGKGL